MVDYVRYQFNETDKEVEKQDTESEEVFQEPEKTIAEEQTPEASGDDSSAETETVSDLDRIKEVLAGESRGMKAGKIADLLDMTKKDVNRILYANQDVFVSDFFKNWRLR